MTAFKLVFKTRVPDTVTRLQQIVQRNIWLWEQCFDSSEETVGGTVLHLLHWGARFQSFRSCVPLLCAAGQQQPLLCRGAVSRGAIVRPGPMRMRGHSSLLVVLVVFAFVCGFLCNGVLWNADLIARWTGRIQRTYVSLASERSRKLPELPSHTPELVLGGKSFWNVDGDSSQEPQDFLVYPRMDSHRFSRTEMHTLSNIFGIWWA